MRHIHTSIVSRHLTARYNNKIRAHLHHTFVALKRYYPVSFVAPLPIPDKINHPSSNHTYTKSMPKHTHHHYAHFVTPTYTTHMISSTTPTYAPHCLPWICGQTLPDGWTEKLAGGSQAGGSDSPPPTSKRQGSG